MAIVFRRAEPADVDAVVALVESAYRGDASRAGWTTEADLLAGQRTDYEAVAGIVADPRSVLLLALTDGEPIACCHVQRHDDYAYFGMFAVRPGLQGGGVGKLLLGAAEELARTEWGVAQMHMTVITARTELISWYLRRGYARTGKISPFPYGDERAGLPQRADLEFELLVKVL